jgi:hypothetical protein
MVSSIRASGQLAPAGGLSRYSPEPEPEPEPDVGRRAAGGGCLLTVESGKFVAKCDGFESL